MRKFCSHGLFYALPLLMHFIFNISWFLNANMHEKIPLCLSTLLCSALCTYLQSLMQIFCFYSQYFFPPIHNSFIHMKPRVYEYSSMSECNNLESESEKNYLKLKVPLTLLHQLWNHESVTFLINFFPISRATPSHE